MNETTFLDPFGMEVSGAEFAEWLDRVEADRVRDQERMDKWVEDNAVLDSDLELLECPDLPF
jgi:hypothetical protein